MLSYAAPGGAMLLNILPSQLLKTSTISDAKSLNTVGNVHILVPIFLYTVRNAVPDADAGSVVRCCAVLHLTTVPVLGQIRGSGPRSRISVSILKRVPHFFKAKL
jgi:hypothetical protein